MAKIIAIGPAGKPLDLALHLCGNLRQQGLALGVDLIFSEAIYLLKVKLAWRNVRHMLGLALVGHGPDHRSRRRISIKSNDKIAPGRGLALKDFVDENPSPGACVGNKGTALLRSAR